MAQLNTQPNLRDADEFYASLLAAYEGLEDDAVHSLNAKLILTLANHIGDTEVFRQALDVAKG